MSKCYCLDVFFTPIENKGRVRCQKCPKMLILKGCNKKYKKMEKKGQTLY